MKPSEWLKQKGWKPVRTDVDPQETLWIDPKDDDNRLGFLGAVMEQATRSEREDEKVTS